MDSYPPHKIIKKENNYAFFYRTEKWYMSAGLKPC